MGSMGVEHKRTVERYPRAVAAGDFEVLAEICRPDVANHTPLDNVRGIEELTAYERRIHEAIPGFDVAVEDLVVEGDRVAMRLAISGTHTGPLMGLEPTGRDVAFGNAVFHRMAGGRIAERWVIPDVFGLLRQLGALEGLPQPARKGKAVSRGAARVPHVAPRVGAGGPRRGSRL